jgi:hypothetical protein
MSATLLLKDKILHQGGYIQEIVIWQLPESVKGSTHHFKYSLFFGLPNQRIIGYDNERPKGDHRHYGEYEESYSFTDIQQLVNDFFSDVEKYLGEHNV